MSTAITNTTTAPFRGHSKTMFWRFAWKEFRTIRGLWLAVVLIGLLVQCVEKMMLPGSTDFALTLFYTALSAAVLYAVGAASTAFSVEHEEETYDLLTRLPATWWPLFAAKMLVALVSALLLAGVLAISALMFRGPHSMGEQGFVNALCMMGFAIIEAVAWGTLSSLLIKRPLLAAIATLVAGTLVTTIAINYASHDSLASMSPAAYAQALPLRLTIVAAVFGVSLLAARTWLTPGARRTSVLVWLGDRLPVSLTRPFARSRTDVRRAPKGISRRRMLSRLLWQTWRENWRLLLAPVAVALALIVGIGAALGLIREVPPQYGEVMTFAMSATVLFAPALYGAIAFHSDQRRGSYRFLAEHAARPRYTWLARHIVWHGALLVVWFLMASVIVTLIVINVQQSGMQRLNWFLDQGYPSYSSNEPYELGYGLAIAFRIAIATSCGAFVAYGVGQLFSMALRSEILAAFLALILAFVVAAWVWVVCLWQLSPVWFLLTLFAGLMLATWLRAPDWMAGRNSVRAWLKPALAIIAPALLVAALLPATRLAQMRYRSGTENRGSLLPADEFADLLAAFQSGEALEALKTAGMYMRVAEKLAAGPDEDPLEPWRKPEYLKTSTAAPPGSEEIDPIKIPLDQLPEFRKAQQKRTDLIKQSIATAVKQAMEISQRPTCRVPLPQGQRNTLYLKKDYPKVPYHQLNQLVGVVVGEPMTTPDQPASRFLAALRMSKHLRSRQPTTVVIEQLQAEQNILRRIDEWTLGKDRTKEELQDVLNKLTVVFNSPESPVDALIADHLDILSVIEEKEIPYILSSTPIAPHAYLAYLANQLWWERERAAQALDRITRRNIWEMRGLVNYLNNDTPRELGLSQQRRWLQPDYGSMGDLWVIQEPAAATSWLVLFEYQATVPLSALYRSYCDNLTCRRATLLELALALYRLDHKKYPPQLTDLVPDYLPQLPLDPYSQQPFQYLPNGLNLLLTYWTLNGERHQIEPGTPLFWGSGPGNVRLKEVRSARFDGAPDEPSTNGEEPKPKKEEPQYMSTNEDPGWWNSKTLVFPLKK